MSHISVSSTATSSVCCTEARHSGRQWLYKILGARCHSSTQLSLTTRSATNKAQKPLLFLQSIVSYEQIQPMDCFCPALMMDVDFIQCYITASSPGCWSKSWLNPPSKGCCVLLLPFSKEQQCWEPQSSSPGCLTLMGSFPHPWPCQVPRGCPFP